MTKFDLGKFRTNAIRVFAVKQQKLVITANDRLSSVPISARWHILRFFYMVQISLFDIAIYFIGQNNLSWFLSFIIMATFATAVFLFKFNILLLAVLAFSLFFLGNVITYKRDWFAFLFMFSIFLSVFEINLLAYFVRFTSSFLLILFGISFLANLGFIVIFSFILIFFVRIFSGVRKWQKKNI